MMKALLNSHFPKIILFVGLFFLSTGAFGQVTFTDSVCAGSQDVVYGITNANPTSTYNWWLDVPAAGTIDNSFATNDSIIQIDWGTTTGTYTLFAEQTTVNGCISDTVQLNIVINPLPTVALTGDSICEGFTASLTFDFTGTAPWIVDYTDGTTNFTDTATATPFVVTTPTYNTAQTITVTGLTDGNGCAADPAGLPTAPVHIYSKPATGPIYHY